MTQFSDIQKELQGRDLGRFIGLELAGEIAYRRGGLGWTQKELSERSGIPQKTISRIENGIELPKLHTVGILLKTMGVKPSIQFEYEDIKIVD